MPRRSHTASSCWIFTDDDFGEYEKTCALSAVTATTTLVGRSPLCFFARLPITIESSGDTFAIAIRETAPGRLKAPTATTGSGTNGCTASLYIWRYFSLRPLELFNPDPSCCAAHATRGGGIVASVGSSGQRFGRSPEGDGCYRGDDAATTLRCRRFTGWRTDLRNARAGVELSARDARAAVRDHRPGKAPAHRQHGA